MEEVFEKLYFKEKKIKIFQHAVQKNLIFIVMYFENNKIWLNLQSYFTKFTFLQFN